MSSPPSKVLEISRNLSDEDVGRALAKAARDLTKTWAPVIVGTDRNTPTNWEKGRGIAPLRWLAIAFRADPASVYPFLAEIGVRPGVADEAPEDPFAAIVADLREAHADPALRARVEAIVGLARMAIGRGPPGERRAAQHEGSR